MKHIVVIGEICEDIYEYVKVKDYNPEGKFPIYEHIKTVVKRGMTSNVELALKKLGNLTTLVTDVSHFEPKIKKTRYIDIDSNKLLYRVDTDEYIPDFDMHQIAEGFENCDAVVICDYGKGMIDNFISLLAFHYKDITPIYLDPYHTRKLEFYESLFHKNLTMTPNRKEANAIFGPSPTIGMTELVLKHDMKFLFKMSEHGMTYNSMKDQFSVDALLNNFEVVDVCGAGDITLATFVHYQLQGLDNKKCVKLANCAAALSLEHIGNYQPLDKEIQDLFKKEYPNG